MNLQLSRFSEDTGRFSITKTSVVQSAIAAAKYLQGHVLLREALQNSCDSQDPAHSSIGFRVSFGEFSDAAVTALRDNVFPQASQELLPEIDTYLKQINRTFLAISDTKTSGLDGGTSRDIDIESFGNFLKFFFVYGENEDKSAAHAGGSAGVGRTIFTNSSLCNTILVFSRVEVGGVSELRMMGYTNGSLKSVNGKTFTGRHWWGASNASDPSPVLNEEAAQLAEMLGLEDDLPKQNGTLIVILGPSFNDRDSAEDPLAQGELLFEEMRESALLFAWPHLVDETVEFSFIKNGSGDPLPAIDTVPGIRSFVNAYRKLQGDEVEQIHVGRRHLLMGYVAKTVTLRDEAPDWFASEVGGSAVALMRQAKFVVKYLPVDNPVDGGFARGVFLSSDGEPDAIFRKSEPAAHDDWLPAKLALPSGAPNFVKLTLEKVSALFKTQLTESAISDSDHSAHDLSKIFGQELASEGTWGPGHVIDPGGGGGAGGGGSKQKAKLLEVGNVETVAVNEGYATSRFRFKMEGQPAKDSTFEVGFTAKVWQADGAMEESAPLGYATPKIIRISTPSGVTGQETIRVTSSQWAGELMVFVTAPIECAVVCVPNIRLSAGVEV